MNATLWIEQWDHFSVEHLEEWAEQKEQECALNDLERDMEVMYRACIIRMQEDKISLIARKQPRKTCRLNDGWLTRKAGRCHAQKDCVSSTSMSATLYPDWVLSRAGKTYES